MKNLILVLVTIFLISCNNDREIEKSKSIVGKWKWIESSGGIDGRIENPITTGRSIVLEFTESTIKTYENGLLTSEGNYQIQLQNSILGGQREMIIITTDPKQFKRSYEIVTNNLYLRDECFDCFQSKYIKQ
ncbi:hypothetical protein [Flavobacterium sp. TSSA_36]|uniref:hypothetical protein n=1 Tax=Flavobacterium sp. TSSA_36 TaxID=3447669 RepID=UPI003F308C58